MGRNPKGDLVQAATASRDIPYVCPGCGATLVLRKGEVRATHFAHKGTGDCSADTALHLGVKAWIAGIFRKRLERRRTRLPTLLAPCRGPQAPGALPPGRSCPGKAWFGLSELVFDEVAEERTTLEGLRPDVLLLQGGVPVLGIEVRVTHGVDSAKEGRTTHPWIELEAAGVLRAPQAWKPTAGRHPWTSRCPHCQVLDRMATVELSEPCDPGDGVAELAAEFFLEAHHHWLHGPRRRGGPRILWKCPWCRKGNQRHFQRQAVLGAARATGLGPPIRPQVIVHLSSRSDLVLAFARIPPPHGRKAVRLEGPGPTPVILRQPDPLQPLKLRMQGTNRPGAFLCHGCGGDCVGVTPPPWSPVPWAEARCFRNESALESPVPGAPGQIPAGS